MHVWKIFWTTFLIRQQVPTPAPHPTPPLFLVPSLLCCFLLCHTLHISNYVQRLIIHHVDNYKFVSISSSQIQITPTYIQAELDPIPHMYWTIINKELLKFTKRYDIKLDRQTRYKIRINCAYEIVCSLCVEISILKHKIMNTFDTFDGFFSLNW